MRILKDSAVILGHPEQAEGHRTREKRSISHDLLGNKPWDKTQQPDFPFPAVLQPY